MRLTKKAFGHQLWSLEAPVKLHIRVVKKPIFPLFKRLQLPLVLVHLDPIDDHFDLVQLGLL